MLHGGDAGDCGLDDLPAAREPVALIDGEHGHGAAARRLGETPIEQFHRTLALAAGSDEVVDEHAAGGARQPHDDGGGDRPRPDRDPWSAGAGVAEATDDAMHDGPPWVVRSDAGAPAVAAWSTVRAGTGAVARPPTGWPSPARRVVGGRRRVVFPRAAETRSACGWMTAPPTWPIVGRCPPTSRDGPPQVSPWSDRERHGAALPDAARERPE